MKRSIATWTITISAAALLAAPTASVAQSAMQPPATTPSTATAPSTPSQANTAQEHLRHARAALNDVTATGLSARGKAQVAELKRRLTTLERTPAAKSSAWAIEVAAMDKVLTNLLASGVPAGTSDTTTTPTAKGKVTATVSLDEASRAKLTEYGLPSRHAAAMSGQPAAAPSDAQAATTSTPMPTDPSVPPAQATAPPATQPAAAPKPKATDDEGARRHLTEARNTLNGLTQLPGAAQLTGDARTQVSQLISNFNDLITTQSDWRAAYAKVAANLAALLGPDTGTTEPTSATGTAGAVGTQGSAPAMDPALRAKLVEMRKNLTDFERAAGGTTTSASASAPAAAPTTTAPATTTEPATAPAAHADSMGHVTAIEAMLKTPNAAGGLTLDKAQADMLRAHLTELKKLLEQAKK